MKKKKYWAGFCDGKLKTTMEHWGVKPPMMAIYPRRKDAKRRFEDVRPVEVKEIKK